LRRDAHVHHVDDVLVGNGGRGLGLPVETLDDILFCGELGVQELDRHPLADNVVLHQID
jgi:hypothetical protein